MKTENINGCANELTREGFAETRYKSLGCPINRKARVWEPGDTGTHVDDLCARASFQNRDQFMREMDKSGDIESSSKRQKG